MNAAAISCRQLTFSYAAHSVLNIDSLDIQHGERVFVFGPSGSGKSTLLGLIGGVLLPTQGQLRVLDQELAELSGAVRDQFRANHIGLMFQMYNLLPYLSVLDNVLLPARFSPLRAQRVLANGSLHDEAQRLLQALGLKDAALHARTAAQLSQGQQQRVAAARALFGSPDLVIADEPTSALDADACDDFLRLLLSECARRNTTVLFVSHDRRLQQHFERSIDMRALQNDQTAGVT